ncbi:MAG: hypothetical protein R2827_05990 [Bdellovibrionales bacterium]
MHFYAFMGPNQSAENKMAFDKIVEQQPDLFICTAKCKYIQKDWWDQLDDIYEPIGSSTYGKRSLNLPTFKNPTNNSPKMLFQYDI